MEEIKLKDLTGSQKRESLIDWIRNLDEYALDLLLIEYLDYKEE